MYLIGLLLAALGVMLGISGIIGMFRGLGIVGLFYSFIAALLVFFGLALVENVSGENWITPVFRPLTALYDRLGAGGYFLAIMGAVVFIGIVLSAAARR